MILGAHPPLVKTIEVMAGIQLFPDPLHPRPTRDRLQNLLNIVSLDKIYARHWADYPAPGGVGRELAELALYMSDPGEQAYHEIRRKAISFLRTVNFQPPEMRPTPKQNALYYYKKAIKYDDREQANRWLQRYKELGGTISGINKSISKSRPMSFIPIKFRAQFLQDLSSREKKQLKMAERWWRETYVEGRNKFR
jgi:hypothetical protein